MQELLRKYHKKLFCKVTLDNVCQASIIITGAVQTWLLTRGDIELSTLGCIIGLVGAPFWLYTSYKNKQVGIFLISIWYVLCFMDSLMS